MNQDPEWITLRSAEADVHIHITAVILAQVGQNYYAKPIYTPITAQIDKEAFNSISAKMQEYVHNQQNK